MRRAERRRPGEKKGVSFALEEERKEKEAHHVVLARLARLRCQERLVLLLLLTVVRESRPALIVLEGGLGLLAREETEPGLNLERVGHARWSPQLLSVRDLLVIEAVRPEAGSVFVDGGRNRLRLDLDRLLDWPNRRNRLNRRGK